VAGWDDPRLPTIAGMRRRGYPPAAIRAFAERVGVTKVESLTDVALLEHCVRDELNATAPRRMAVLNPLKLVVDNLSDDGEEWFDAVNNPERPEEGTRRVPFGKVLYIERDDFMLDPPKKFYRLSPGREVRLRYACLFTCTSVVTDPATGEVTEVHGTWDPASRGGTSPDGRQVKGTIHWVSAKHAVALDARLYDRLFTVEDPMGDPERDYASFLNPDSLKTVTALAEPALADGKPGERFQFERLGYFCADSGDSRPGKPVFNRIVALRDSWAKIAAK
jgi:glutaminyl-tRNA synthetase